MRPLNKFTIAEIKIIRDFTHDYFFNEAYILLGEDLKPLPYKEEAVDYLKSLHFLVSLGLWETVLTRINHQPQNFSDKEKYFVCITEIKNIIK